MRDSSYFVSGFLYEKAKCVLSWKPEYADIDTNVRHARELYQSWNF